MSTRNVISILITAFHALLGCVFAFILLVLGYPAIWVQIMIWQNLTLSGVVFAALALRPWRVSPPDSAEAPDNAAAPNSPEAPGNPMRTLRAQEGGRVKLWGMNTGTGVGGKTSAQPQFQPGVGTAERIRQETQEARYGATRPEDKANAAQAAHRHGT